jgi:hypothetical protein
LSETELPDPDPTLSSDAADSTYAPSSTDRSAEHPPPGPAVEQTLGKPGSGGTKTTKKSAGSSSLA